MPEEEDCSYICPVLHPVISNNHNLLHVKNTCYFLNFCKSEGYVLDLISMGQKGREKEFIDRLEGK